MLVSWWPLRRVRLLLVVAVAAAALLLQLQPTYNSGSVQVAPSLPHFVAASAHGAFRDVDQDGESSSERPSVPGGRGADDASAGRPRAAAAAAPAAAAAAAGPAQSSPSDEGAAKLSGSGAEAPQQAAAAAAATEEESVPRLIRRPFSARSGDYLKLPQSFIKKQLDAQGRPVDLHPEQLDEQIERMFNMRPEEVEMQTDAIARSVDAFRSVEQPTGRLIIAVADLQAAGIELQKEALARQKRPESANKQSQGVGSSGARSPPVTREQAEALGRAAVNGQRLEELRVAEKVKVLPDVGLVVIDFSPTATVDEIKDTVKDIWMRSPSAWLIEPDSEVTIRMGVPSDGPAAPLSAAAPGDRPLAASAAGSANGGGGAPPAQPARGLEGAQVAGAPLENPSNDRSSDSEGSEEEEEGDSAEESGEEPHSAPGPHGGRGDGDDSEGPAAGSGGSSGRAQGPALRQLSREDGGGSKKQQDRPPKSQQQKKGKHSKDIQGLQAEPGSSGSSSSKGPSKKNAGSAGSSKPKAAKEPAHKGGKMRAQGLEEKAPKQQRQQQQRQQQPKGQRPKHHKEAELPAAAPPRGHLSPEPVPASHIQQLQLLDPLVATDEQFSGHFRRLDALSSLSGQEAAPAGGAAAPAAPAAEQQPTAVDARGKTAAATAVKTEAAAAAADPLKEMQKREAFLLVEGESPNDQYYSRQWALHHSIYGSRMPEAWRLAYTSRRAASRSEEGLEKEPEGKLLAKRNVHRQPPALQPADRQKVQQQSLVVAVIDTGVDYHHEDLKNKIWINSAEIPNNGIDDDGNGYVDDYYGYDFEEGRPDPMDELGHGTHVAGIVAASANNGVGIAGANWRVKVMPLKFHRRSSAAVEAIAYSIRMGAKISTNSWGFAFRSEALRVAVEQAETHGQLFVCAVNNAGADNTKASDFPPNWGYDWRTGQGFRNLLRVANLTSTGALAPSSNYGRYNVDIAAPGTEIISTLPRRVYGDNYGFKSGTSMATPLVAGVAAMVWGERPSLTAVEVREILMHTATRLPALKDTTATGGTVNAAAAVALAQALNEHEKGRHSHLVDAFTQWKARQASLHLQAVANQQGVSSSSGSSSSSSSSGHSSYGTGVKSNPSHIEGSAPAAQPPSSDSSSSFPSLLPTVPLPQPLLLPQSPPSPAPTSASAHFESSPSSPQGAKSGGVMPSAATSTPFGLSSLLVQPLSLINSWVQNSAAAFTLF